MEYLLLPLPLLIIYMTWAMKYKWKSHEEVQPFVFYLMLAILLFGMGLASFISF